jgi:hypothetical protein
MLRAPKQHLCVFGTEGAEWPGLSNPWRSLTPRNLSRQCDGWKLRANDGLDHENVWPRVSN